MSAVTGGTTSQSTSKGAAHAQQGTRSGAARVGSFARHFLEMCATMCLGVVLLDPVYVWAAGLIGYGDPFFQLPELSALVLAFNMTAPMVAWMRFRGMDWRSIAEMSAAMVAEAVLIIGGYWLGILPNVSTGTMPSLGRLQHSLMLPAMLVPMLLRFDRYAGHAGHTRHVARDCVESKPAAGAQASTDRQTHPGLTPGQGNAPGFGADDAHERRRKEVTTTTDTKRVSLSSMNGQARSVAANVRRLLLRFLELQIPMGLGALVCYLAVSLIPASSSFATIYHPGTYLFTIGDVFFLTVPVVAWMIFRGHGWRHSLGMAVAMVAPVATIIMVGQLAGYPSLLWLITAGYPTMCLGILIYMRFRLDA